MNKVILTLLMGLLAFSLAACNDKEEAKKEPSQTDETTEEDTALDPEEMQRKLDEQKVKDDTIVAIVNGQEIKGSEYNEALSLSQMQFQQMGQDPTTEETAKQLKEYTLDSLVGQTLLMQEVDKKGYEASEEKINKELDTLKAQYENEEAFEQALKDNNLTLEKLKEQISDTVKYSQYIEKDLNVEEVKEEEVKKYYDQFASSAGGSEDTPKYEDIKETLKLQLEQQKTQEKVGTKVDELRQNAEIELKI